MLPFIKAHAYGNDFIYVEGSAAAGQSHDDLARELCDRHTGIGADGLVLYTRTPAGASMTLYNADGSRAEVSGNGVRGLAAVLLREGIGPQIAIEVDAGLKQLTRTPSADARPTFRAAMGLPADLRQFTLDVEGESVSAVTMNFGNPQCVLLGSLPTADRFARLGAALARAPMFPNGSNVEFASVEARDLVRILIWERGVGPTTSSGTGSCAALIAAAAYAGADRDATVIAPGGAQRVEWREDSVYLTGWAEVLVEGRWLRTK